MGSLGPLLSSMMGAMGNMELDAPGALSSFVICGLSASAHQHGHSCQLFSTWQQQHVAILHSLPQTVIFTQSYRLLLLLLLLPLLQCSRVIKAKQLVHSRNSSTEPHFDIKMAAHLLLRYIKNRQTMQTHLTQMLSLAVDANYSHKCWLLLQRGMLFCNDCNSMLLVMIQVVASPMHPMTAATSAGWCCRAACCFRMDRWRFPRAAKAGCTSSLGTARAAPTSPCISLNPASC